MKENEDFGWLVGGFEHNLGSDVAAANVVFRSKVQLWQIPGTIYKRMVVSYAEPSKRFTITVH